jgi:flagellar biosynthesis component FlhA
MVDYVLLFAGVVVALFAPIPVIVYEIILGMLLFVTIGFMCLGPGKYLFAALLKCIRLFCLILPAVSLGLTKQFFTGNLMNDSSSAIAFLAGKVHGRWWILEIVVTVLFLAVNFFIVSKNNSIFGEQAYIELQSMPNKIFDIQSSFNNDEISYDEAEKRKKAVRKKVDDAYLILSTSKSLVNMIKTTFVIAVLNVVWVFIQGILMDKLPIIEAMQLFMPFACMNIIAAIIPQITMRNAMVFYSLCNDLIDVAG